MTVFNPQNDLPLNEDELNELQAFLISDIAPEDALSLEGLDGFFCGLAVSPELVMPSEWLPLVWGDEEGPAFESEEQAERILGLIMRHWNSVNRAVRVRPDHDALFYMPLMFEPEGNPPDSAMDTGFGEAWASGFLMGTQIDIDEWGNALQNQAVSDCFGPIILLEQGKNPDKPEVVVDYAERQSLAALLPAIAHELWLHWQSGEHTERPGVPYRAGPHTGRNDPCPCGSGKKYKRCCLQ